MKNLTFELFNVIKGTIRLLFPRGGDMTAKDVAEYFLSLSDPECEDFISNLKLQKLVYYAQGFNLAIHDKLLFAEPIEAWTHGPVIKSLYHQYKDKGASAIEPPVNIDLKKYPEEVKDLLDEIWIVYGQYSASKLRNLTHAEPPWMDAYEQGPSSTITQDSMRKFFKTLLA